ncbi:MAG: efflux RND transporter periplasmic adaptor subunit [Inquilinaceae bacterium]
MAHIRHIASLLALCAVGLTACDDAPAPKEAPPKPIAWATVEPAGEATIRSLPGVVRAIQRAELSFEVAGRVETVTVEVGDHFDEGQELARLDAHSYELTVRERRSELGQAEANLAEATNDFERQRQLHEDGWVAQAGYDLALSQRDAARSQVEMAGARLAIAEDDLADTVLSAPYSGTVAARLIEPSQQIGTGQTAFEIQSNGGGLEIEVAFPETLIDRLAVGTDHGVSFPTRPALTLTGRVREIGSRATDGNAFPVTLALAGAPADLRTGITAEVAFDVSPSGATGTNVVIPDTAFLAGDDDATLAFVFDEETGTLQAREIVIEDISGNQAIVSQGLLAGEVIAAKGLPFLKDGQRVELLGVGLERYNQ